MSILIDSNAAVLANMPILAPQPKKPTTQWLFNYLSFDSKKSSKLVFLSLCLLQATLYGIFIIITRDLSLNGLGN